MWPPSSRAGMIYWAMQRVYISIYFSVKLDRFRAKTIIQLQCFNSSCIETRGALPLERRGTEKFCPHVVKASEALNCKQFAVTETIDIQEIVAKVSDENLEKSLLNESSDGDLTIYKLPSGNIAVPILDMFSSRTSGPFVHVRESKCELGSCSKTKSKKHTLLEKGVSLCPHIMIGIVIIIPLFPQPTTQKKLSKPKLDPQLNSTEFKVRLHSYMWSTTTHHKLFVLLLLLTAQLAGRLPVCVTHRLV